MIRRLRSYSIPDARDNTTATICEVAMTTASPPGYFPGVPIGHLMFCDGALGANNPVAHVEAEASIIWASDEANDVGLQSLIKCFISIGTGNAGKNPVEEGVIAFFRKTALRIATSRESAAKTTSGTLNFLSK